MVGGRTKFNVPKQKMILRQTLCEPPRVTDDSQQRGLGERRSQDGGFHISFSLLSEVLVSQAAAPSELQPWSRPGKGGACPRGGAAWRGGIFLKKVISILYSIGSYTALLCIRPPSGCQGLLGFSRVLQPLGYGVLVRGGSSGSRGPDPRAGNPLSAELRRRYLGRSRF